MKMIESNMWCLIRREMNLRKSDVGILIGKLADTAMQIDKASEYLTNPSYQLSRRDRFELEEKKETLIAKHAEITRAYRKRSSIKITRLA